MIKLVLTALRMVPLVEAVSIPFVASFIDDDDRFQPNEILTDSARAMLDELVRVEDALRPLRKPAA
jgi:hypothetical protein